MLKRLKVLDALDPNGKQGAGGPYIKAKAALATWAGQQAKAPATDVFVRQDFILRQSDKDLDPPLKQLISSRGHKLQFALIALFLAQCQHPPGRRLALPLRAQPDDDAIAWTDFVAIPAKEGPGSTSREDLPRRERSARNALDALATPEISLVEFAESKPGKKYRDLRLLQDSGPRTTGPAAPYTVPKSSIPVVRIPTSFFTNGWIYVLTDAEIATYLMYRHLCAEATSESAHITAGSRKARFALEKSTWESHPVLTGAGLLDMEADPNRRADGTVVDAPAAVPEPHRFTLTDAGLDEDALKKVWGAISDLTE